MKKILVLLLGAAISALLFILLFQDFFFRIAFESAVTRLTGFKTKIGSFHYQYPGAIHIQALKLYNPPGFAGPVFADCSRVYLVMNMPEFVRREKSHIYLLEINLRDIYLEKNPQGVLNLELLKPLAAGGPAGRLEGLPFELEQLQLTAHHAVYWDRSPGAPPPLQKTVSLNLEREEWNHLNDVKAIFQTLISKILEEAGLTKTDQTPPAVLEETSAP